MKSLLIFLFFSSYLTFAKDLVLPNSSSGANKQRYFQEANQYYQNQQYQEALRIYEDLLVQAGESPELRMNAGNASLQIYRDNSGSNRIGYLARAVRHFELAKRLSPDDEEISHNLFFARGLSGETLEKNKKMPMLLSWLLLRPLSLQVKSLILGFLACLLLVLSLHLFWPASLPTRLHRFLPNRFLSLNLFGLICFLYVSLLTLTLLTTQKLKDSRVGIIKEATVQARFEPTKDSPTAFELREGAIVSRLKSYGDWTLVEPQGFGGGIEAWVQNAELMDL